MGAPDEGPGPLPHGGLLLYASPLWLLGIYAAICLWLYTTSWASDDAKGVGMNYLLVAELPRGKLVNLRPARIEHEFVNTSLTSRDRRQFRIDDSGWRRVSDADQMWKDWITAAIRDWGTGLDRHLYSDAITHVLGGEERVVGEFAIVDRGEILGRQEAHFSGPNAIYRVTTLNEGKDAFVAHARRLLDHSRIDALHWLNIARDLVEFHTAHKRILLAHSPKAFQELGRLVAGSKRMPRQELCRQYQTEFMATLKILATRGRHANVLQHMAGYFKKQLDEDSRQELHDSIEDYRKGYLPLIVPVILIKHYVRQFGVRYLEGQAYLNPHPKELALRNHV